MYKYGRVALCLSLRDPIFFTKIVSHFSGPTVFERQNKSGTFVSSLNFSFSNCYFYFFCFSSQKRLTRAFRPSAGPGHYTECSRQTTRETLVTSSRVAPKARQNTMGPARSVSFMMLPSATFSGCSTVSVFCQMWSKLMPSSARGQGGGGTQEATREQTEI